MRNRYTAVCKKSALHNSLVLGRVFVVQIKWLLILSFTFKGTTCRFHIEKTRFFNNINNFQ